ncbi:NYN domain-containing protein [Lachnospira multipara]|uniref:NYN domain-containing protein n=1 Tax=Lachnospira multipara TaxID=28051 RepID=UPI000484A2D2|nr:NYN domain-containing protein [Lachnospira multipara]
MDDKRYAVLIDSDNISSKYIRSILDEMTKYGVVTYKRIYGDWTSPQSGKWKKELMENSITPIQQFRNTVGKNATDSTLIIDAMDILYTHSVNGFCIVSSDGDFTKLASRLRESGMEVIGMGENKTPKSFRAACSVFTDLELIVDQNEDEVETDTKQIKKPKNILKQSVVENAIIEIITENDNKGRQSGLGEIGSRLQKKYSDFDVRNYGYSSLSKFLEEIEGFDVININNTVIVRLREDLSVRKHVTDFAIKSIEDTNGTGMELGALGQRIHGKYPNFKVKEYGYSTLSKFINSIKSLTIRDVDGRKIVLSVDEEDFK